MCGIAGIAKAAQETPSREALIRMAKALAHRGPDAEGFWDAPGIALAHRRLAVLDVSDLGIQPMHSPDGRYSIIFNGEIYNFREIRATLTSHTFHTQTDTEMVLAAFAQWGPDCLEKFHGMWAMAIWDNQEKRLFLSRDRMGIKPLYFSQQGGDLYFASEVRAVLAGTQNQAKINRGALGDFLRYQTVYSPETMVEGILQLPAGSYAWYQSGNLKITRFWETVKRASGYQQGDSLQKVHQEIRDRLRAAVQRRLVADVPLGAFLSGGIDSSAVVGLMAETSDLPVETFSVVFSEKEYDESTWSGMVAEKFKTQHHPILLKPQRFLEELPSALAAMDHPSGDGVNSYVVSKVTREAGMTVALSGLGGDEFFAGYPFFTQLAQLQQKKILKTLPYPIRKLMAGMATVFPGGRRGQKIADVLRLRDTSLESVFPVYRRLYSGELANTLLSPTSQGENGVEQWLKKNRQDWQKLPLLSQISVAEADNYMQHILLRDTDQMSMAHALEVRVPFLDHELISYVLSIPDSLKYPTYPKQLLVESLGDLLPHEVVHRKKMGFTFPWELWLRNELAPFCTDNIARVDDAGLFLPGSGAKLLDRFRKGDKTVIWAHIWLLAILGDWMNRNSVQA